MILASGFEPHLSTASLAPGLHIPDGFLSLTVSLACWAVAVTAIALATRRLSGELGERLVPLMGVMGAFVFAAQTINFPVAGGTSGHVLGGALAAITLGPWAGMLVMTAVIALQALLLQDGGLVVMGANILNMGVVTAAIGYGLYRIAAGRPQRVRAAAAGAAAWLSVVAAAFLTSLQLWLSGTTSLRLVLPAMLGVHVLIGIGEALITVAALTFILQTRADVLAPAEVTARGGRAWVIVGLSTAALVVLLAPWASVHPDGLESVAHDLGFLGSAARAPFELLPDYSVPALGQSNLSTIAAGLIGLVTVAAASVGVGVLLRRRAPSSPRCTPAPSTVTGRARAWCTFSIPGSRSSSPFCSCCRASCCRMVHGLAS